MSQTMWLINFQEENQNENINGDQLEDENTKQEYEKVFILTHFKFISTKLIPMHQPFKVMQANSKRNFIM